MIRENKATCKVHTFGIGSGVSTELIKNCAVSGGGHFYFIDNLAEIEKKVLNALSKEFFDYLCIKDVKLLNP